MALNPVVRSRPTGPRLRHIPWITALSLLVAIGLWEVAGRFAHVIALPTFGQISAAWVQLYHQGLLGQLATSGRTLLIGVAIAVAAALTLAALASLSKNVNYIIRPYIDIGMSLPITAIVPILMLLFGLGDTTRIVVVFLFAFFPMMVSFQAALQKVDPNHLEMARAFDASTTATFMRITLPSALPLMLTGVRLGLSRGIEGVIIAEIIISVDGIGWVLIQASNLFDIAQVDATIATIVIIALLIMGGLALLERRLHRLRS